MRHRSILQFKLQIDFLRMLVNFMRHKNTNLLICKDEECIAKETAERFICAAIRSVAETGEFYVALSGGNSPKEVFKLLATDEFARFIPWSKTHVFFTDERCVPPDSPDSNYRLAYDLLLSKVPIPESNIYRFHSELPPEEAADIYNETIRNVMGYERQFDLIMLGMGSDMHTASLFPHSPALDEMHRFATANYIEKLNAYRLTLTIPVLSSARSIIILVMGQEKAEALSSALNGPYDPHSYPVQAIQPIQGNVLWLVDKEAASKL